MSRVLIGVALVLALVAGLGLAAYAMGWELDSYTGLAGRGPGGPAGGSAALSEDEVESILYVREEEKLARDVYLALYEAWGLDVFKNISESEQRHMDAVLKLIEKYGLEDPAVDEVGVFTNPEIQELYNQLVEKGTQSLEDAILVGGLIEEMDIIDLTERISATDNQDIARVFSNLMDGSVNHLQAFAKLYKDVTGSDYQPQLLDEETYQSIIQGQDSGSNGNRPHGVNG